jgi:hypothetical protein
MLLTVKTPVAILSVIAIGFISLLYLLTATDTDMYRTFSAEVVMDNRGEPYIEVVLDGVYESLDNNALIYWYTDRQDTLYRAQDYECIVKDEGTVIRIRDNVRSDKLLQNIGQSGISVDIAVGNATIADRVLGKGKSSSVW